MNFNLSAPCNSLGYGISGFNLLRTLMESGNEVAFWPIGQPECHPNYHDLIRSAIQQQGSYNKDAISIRHYHQFDLAQHVGKGLQVGSTIFELNRFSDREIHHLQSQDIVLVPSRWAQSILAENNIDKTSGVLNCGVDRMIFHEEVKPLIKNTTNKTVFMNVCKWEYRKGHDILVEIFNKAFTSKDNVELVMACYNPFYSQEKNKEWEDLYKNSPLGHKIRVYTKRDEEFKYQENVASLMASADCGIYPSRAEGWNLSALEMASLGKQVILTNYSGHTEWVDDDAFLLIEPEGLESAYDGVWFHGQGNWMAINDNQIDQTVEHMRNVHEKKQSGELCVNIRGIEVAKKFSWENASEKMILFLKEQT